MKINQAGLDLIKSFEGCKLTAYQDIIGVWTIGYGATGPGIGPNVGWSQEEADQRLAADLERFERGVESMLTREISENAFSALVCFAYNVGLHNLETSHLLLKVNDGDMSGAAAQFLRWDRAGGNEVAGLLRRRQAESALFLSS